MNPMTDTPKVPPGTELRSRPRRYEDLSWKERSDRAAAERTRRANEILADKIAARQKLPPLAATANPQKEAGGDIRAEEGTDARAVLVRLVKRCWPRR